MNTFEFVGKIIPCKETEKFKPYNERFYNNSEWGKKLIKFNVVCGSNRHLVELSELINKDMSKTKIFTFSKGTVDSSGNKAKGKILEIAFKDRTNPEIIEKVAEFKKYVVDTEEYGRRFALEKAIDKFKDGTIDDEQMNKLGVHNIDECSKALADSKKKKHEFISAYDAVDFLNKFVNSEKIKDMVFKVTGTYDLDYNLNDDRWYRHFTVQKIYRVANDTEQLSHGTFNFTFGRDAVDTNDYDETKKYHVNGYLSTYLRNLRGNFFTPITFTIDGNGENVKKAETFKKKFVFPDDCDNEYREIGLSVDILDGAQKMELTDDMLTDEQKENLECGLITMDDIKKELGKPIYGDRVTDMVITGLARGYSNGANNTAYNEADFGKPHVKTEEKTEADNKTDNDDDIFDDEDDI